MKNLYAQGTNQYRKRYKTGQKVTKSRRSHLRGRIGAVVLIAIFSLILLHYMTLGIVSGSRFIEHLVSKEFIALAAPASKIVSPLPQSTLVIKQVSPPAEYTPTPTNQPVFMDTEPESQISIEEYMKKIFGSDFRVARAVSHNECNPANAHYPACVLHTNAEYSVGLFQINLYNTTQWIHAGRIPGATMTQKVAWLENPYNNTLYAYWVFKTSGWTPWSSYTSGNYLRDL